MKHPSPDNFLRPSGPSMDDTEDALLQKVYETIQRVGLLHRGDRVLVGVSGGADSVCLMHLLQELAPRLEIEPCIVHFHHGLRGGEADEDEAFVLSLAQNLGFLFKVGRGDVASLAKEKGISKQMAGRQLRYGFFEAVAKDIHAQRIALGHTWDDQVETLMMRLLRGTGSEGLQGIPIQRDGFIVRPLLLTTRREIEEYLRDRNIFFREDSSNQQSDYLRNRVRKKLLPFLEEEFNPQIRETLYREAMIFSQEGDFVRQEASLLYHELRREEEEGMHFELKSLEILHPSLRWQILRMAMHSFLEMGQGVEMKHVLAVEGLVDKPKGHVLQITKNLRVKRDQTSLTFLGEAEKGSAPWAFPLLVPGEMEIDSTPFTVVSHLIKGVLPKTTGENAVFDWERVPRPLEIRNWREGDFFYPRGLGGRKKLQDFFVDQKIPRRRRKRIPLLASSEGVLWVMGWRLDGRFLAHSTTRTKLVVNFSKKG